MILDLYMTFDHASCGRLARNSHILCIVIWAALRRNQQNGMCAQRRLGSACLIRVFAFRMKKVWVISYPSSAQRTLWSDCADAQADLSPRWAHMPFCLFCHEAAHFNKTWYLGCSLPRQFCYIKLRPLFGQLWPNYVSCLTVCTMCYWYRLPTQNGVTLLHNMIRMVNWRLYQSHSKCNSCRDIWQLRWHIIILFVLFATALPCSIQKS